jgi:putative transposase
VADRRRGGPGAAGPAGNPFKLDDAQFAQLRAALDAGPAAYSWAQGPAVDPSQGRGADHPPVRCLLLAAGLSFLLRRLGFSPQVPVHRAAERNEAAIAGCGR